MAGNLDYIVQYSVRTDPAVFGMTVTFILFITVLFANYAEAVAEAKDAGRQLPAAGSSEPHGPTFKNLAG